MTNERRIEILDVTLRDGEQTSGVSFSKEEKLNITKFLLKDLQVDRVEIASARSSAGELVTCKEIFSWAKKENLLSKIEILGFVDGNRTVDWLLEAGGMVLNLLTKGSLHHLEKQIGVSKEEHVRSIQSVVESARKNGIRVHVYLEDWSNGFRNSREYVNYLLDALVELNISKIFLPDTLGVLSPSETKIGVSSALERHPNVWFEFHGHNDYDLAVANCLEAVSSGVKGLHVSVNGLGERAGNSPMEAVITALHDKLELKTNLVEKEITKASRLVEVFSGKRISANRPIVGADVFTQTAGVHADGDKKGNLYASLILPERFGRERVYALGKLAGKASVSENLKQLGLILDSEMEKKLLDRIIALGDQNKIVTKEDLPYLIADISGNGMSQKFKILSCEVISGIGVKPKAKVVLEYNTIQYSSEGIGDGGYDAFMKAISMILNDLDLKIPALLDYEVTIPPGGKTDALVETVITWEVPGRLKGLRTTGVDSDQQVAAIKATEKMLNLVFKE